MILKIWQTHECRFLNGQYKSFFTDYLEFLNIFAFEYTSVSGVKIVINHDTRPITHKIKPNVS